MYEIILGDNSATIRTVPSADSEGVAPAANIIQISKLADALPHLIAINNVELDIQGLDEESDREFILSLSMQNKKVTVKECWENYWLSQVLLYSQLSDPAIPEHKKELLCNRECVFSVIETVSGQHAIIRTPISPLTKFLAKWHTDALNQLDQFSSALAELRGQLPPNNLLDLLNQQETAWLFGIYDNLLFFLAFSPQSEASPEMAAKRLDMFAKEYPVIVKKLINKPLTRMFDVSFLWESALSRNFYFTEFAMRNGADPNAAHKYGVTPLVTLVSENRFSLQYSKVHHPDQLDNIPRVVPPEILPMSDLDASGPKKGFGSIYVKLTRLDDGRLAIKYKKNVPSALRFFSVVTGTISLECLKITAEQKSKLNNEDIDSFKAIDRELVTELSKRGHFITRESTLLCLEAILEHRGCNLNRSNESKKIAALNMMVVHQAFYGFINPLGALLWSIATVPEESKDELGVLQDILKRLHEYRDSTRGNKKSKLDINALVDDYKNTALHYHALHLAAYKFVLFRKLNPLNPELKKFEQNLIKLILDVYGHFTGTLNDRGETVDHPFLLGFVCNRFSALDKDQLSGVINSFNVFFNLCQNEGADFYHQNERGFSARYIMEEIAVPDHLLQDVPVPMVVGSQQAITPLAEDQKIKIEDGSAQGSMEPVLPQAAAASSVSVEFLGQKIKVKEEGIPGPMESVLPQATAPISGNPGKSKAAPVSLMYPKQDLKRKDHGDDLEQASQHAVRFGGKPGAE